MRPMLRTALLAALASLFVLSAASAVVAQEPTYETQVRSGLDALVRGDRDAGMRSLREAIATNPSRPEAICYLAEAFRVQGDLTGALDNFNMCLNVARSARDTHFVGRAMHGVASTFERMPVEHLNDAREAWLAYTRYCEMNVGVGHPEIGRNRVTAIDTVIELGRVTEEVRARIEARTRTTH
jgi:tetratricopeptide (TPR) repeat protein